jgi:flagellar protein FlaF
MGFSVSGATALLLVAFLLSFGAFYTASTGAFSQVQDAQTDQTDRTVETINTEIGIDSATYNESGDQNLNITVNNTGASTLQLNDTSLLVDGNYVSDWQDAASIDGDSSSYLWLPQETLNISVSRSPTPQRVKIVTEYGVAATATVEVVQ